MSRWLVVASVLSLSIGGAHAAEKISFKGGGTVVAATSACSRHVGDHLEAFYLFPISGSANGSDSTISFFTSGTTRAFQITSASFTTTFKDVVGWHIATRASTYSAKLKLAAALPPITTGTKFLITRVVINNWEEEAGCTVTFDLGLVRSTT